jgi:5'-deoxy-5'-methylthioadenosine phosphorylase
MGQLRGYNCSARALGSVDDVMNPTSLPARHPERPQRSAREREVRNAIRAIAHRVPTTEEATLFMLAIIGGSGLTRLSTLAVAHREVVRTPYGEPSSALLFGQIAGRDAVFLARHGHGHTIAPHRVNYRANLWALRNRGVTAVLAVASVGGIRTAGAGELVVPHQLIDYTHSREATFFDGGEQQVVHVDFTHPYTPELREKCLAAGRAAGIALTDGGVYGAVAGPRLETAAEIDRMDRDGATLVGMTGMPEAVLARELDLPYAAICVVVNHAAGRGDSAAEISMDGINRVLQTGMNNVRRLLDHVAPLV